MKKLLMRLENLVAVSTNVFREITTSESLIGLERVAELPRTAKDGPVSRIQQLIDAPDASDRMYAVDTRGVVFVVEDGEVLDQPLLDLRGRNDARLSGGTFGGEYGLRSIAFHPDFADPDAAGYGMLYTTYSAPRGSRPSDVEVFKAPNGTTPQFDSVVAEWRIVDPENPLRVDASSKRELFRVEEPYANHNVNQLLFDPNTKPGDSDHGLLYVAVADGGGSYNPTNTAPLLGSVAGKLLRIDPLEQRGGDAYGIPDDNPFVDEAGAQPEIWASGLRNPQTLSFDSEAGQRLYIGDIGQDRVEEVNIGLVGADYGWDVREGPVVINGRNAVRLASTNEDDFQYPFTGYDHDTVKTAAGMAAGFVYRGDALPELRGQFVFADFPTGRLFSAPVSGVEAALADGRLAPNEFVDPSELVVEVDGRPTTLAALMGNSTGRVDARLAVDAAGEMYVFGKQTGEIYKFVSIDGGDVDNQAPSITSRTSVSVVENDTFVIDVAANDPEGLEEGNGLRYGLAGGADEAMFQIDSTTGIIRFASKPDFEEPADADRDNVYEVVVEVTDGALTDQAAMAVTVTDEPDTDAPTEPTEPTKPDEPDTTPPPSTRVSFVSESAGFGNVLGWYDMSTNAAEILFTDSNSAAGFSTTIDGVAPDDVGFFLVPDGATAFAPGGTLRGTDLDDLGLRVVEQGGQFVVATIDGFVLQGRADGRSGLQDLAYFTETGKNPDGLGHAKVDATGRIFWEDIFANGDADFNDLVISATPVSIDDTLL